MKFITSELTRLLHCALKLIFQCVINRVSSFAGSNNMSDYSQWNDHVAACAPPPPVHCPCW